MKDIRTVKRNVKNMIDKNYSIEDIDKYIEKNGFSIDQIRNYDLSDNKEQNDTLNTAVGALNAFDRGYTFNYGTKGLAHLYAGGSYPIDRIAEAVGVENTPSYDDRYNDFMDMVEDAKRMFKKEYPLADPLIELGASLRNPANIKGSNFISKGKNLKEISGRGAAVGGAYTLADDIGNDKAENVGLDTVIGTTIGAALPPLQKGINFVSGHVVKTLKDLPSKLDTAADKWFMGILGRTKKEINDTIQKVTNGGEGSAEVMGLELQKQANEGLDFLDNLIRNKYEKIYKYVSRENPAIITQTMNALRKLQNKFLSGTESGNFIKKYIDALAENPNVEQLYNMKAEIGKRVAKGEASAIKKYQLGELYHSIENDYLNSLKRYAGSMGDKVVKLVKAADETFKLYHRPGGMYRRLGVFANENTPPSTLGKKFLSELTQRNSYSRRLKDLNKFEGADVLKREGINYLNDREKFNSLSKTGKNFLYGGKLPEFEELFNNSTKDQVLRRLDKLVNSKGLDSILDMMNKISVTNPKNIPYIFDLARQLVNKN